MYFNYEKVCSLGQIPRKRGLSFLFVGWFPGTEVAKRHLVFLFFNWIPGCGFSGLSHSPSGVIAERVNPTAIYDPSARPTPALYWAIKFPLVHAAAWVSFNSNACFAAVLITLYFKHSTFSSLCLGRNCSSLEERTASDSFNSIGLGHLSKSLR